MDIAAIRQGLADVVEAAIPGLNAFGYVPDSIPEPCFYAGEVEIDYDLAYQRGMDEARVSCRVLVGRAEDKAGQAALDLYLAGSGSSSVKAAIEGTPGVAQTLGGACDDLHVMRVRGYRLYQVGENTYYGAQFTVRVIGAGG